MNILYFGQPDQLAKTFIEKLEKEEGSVYFVSPDTFAKKKQPALKYRKFTYSKKYEINKQIFEDIHPDVVVFAGIGFADGIFAREDHRQQYLSDLSFFLNQSIVYGTKQFIYLSSTQIYGDHGTYVDENTQMKAISSKGIVNAQGEYNVQLYGSKNGMAVTILRCSEIYDLQVGQKRQGFLGEMVAFVEQADGKIEGCNQVYQPIGIPDLCDAIRRAIQNRTDGCLNVVSSRTIKKSRIVEAIGQIFKRPLVINLEEVEERVVSNQRIKKELEWVDFWNLEDELKKGKLVVDLPQKKIKSKKKRFGESLRKLIENLLIFLLFFLIGYVTRDNALFSVVDWLAMYVIIIALNMGNYQSGFAVLLASAAYLLKKDVNITQMTNFYSYVSCVLKMVEYIALGGLVSYYTDQLKEKAAYHLYERDQINQELKELREINRKNVQIKQEYEKRLLNTKDSLPKLYQVISRLNVLEADRIMMETLQVVSEFLETDTVSFYQARVNNPFVRLVASLNEQSIYQGKTWNLEHTPKIYESVKHGEVYVGNIWDKEPSLVAPIMHRGDCIALVVIQKLKFAGRSLYQVNTLRTLTVLLSEQMAKAISYEELIRDTVYIKDTELMKAEEFEKAVRLAREKKEQGLADYTILVIEEEGSWQKVYKKVQGMFRTTDSMTLDRGRIMVLLGNSSQREAENALERLSQKDIRARISKAEGVGVNT